MSDELHRHAAVTINGFLERKDDEDTIGELSNRGEPTRPPRPDLRADVVHDRDTEAPDASRQPEVEIRKIDDDQRIRALVAGDRKSTRLNSSHVSISYAVFCLKKKKPIWSCAVPKPPRVCIVAGLQ